MDIPATQYICGILIYLLLAPSSFEEQSGLGLCTRVSLTLHISHLLRETLCASLETECSISIPTFCVTSTISCLVPGMYLRVFLGEKGWNKTSNML